MRKLAITLFALVTITSCDFISGVDGVPANGPIGVTFTDTDTNITFGGPVTITRAINELDITSYQITWGGLGNCIPIGNVIGQVSPVGFGNIVFSIPVGTTKPVAADKILVFSANSFGQNLDCAFVEVVNDNSNAQVPSTPPDAVSFTDVDDNDTIGGTVNITRAPIELDVTSYVLRFGSGGCNIQNSFIAEIDKTGSDLVYEIPQGTVVPQGATEILAYTKNPIGEMPDCENAATIIENFIDNTAVVTIQHFSGYCLEAVSSLLGGLRTAICDGSLNQSWELVDEAGNGSDFVVMSRGNENLCIQSNFGSSTFIASLCSSSEFQVINFGDPTPRLSGGGNYYEIRNSSSIGSQCIRSDDSPNDPIEPIEADNCDDDVKINWVILDQNSQPVDFPLF